MAKSGRFLDSNIFKNIMTVITWGLTVAIIVFSIFTFNNANNQNFEGASFYMAIVFILMGASQIFTFLKERNGSAFRAIFMSLVNIGLGVLVFFAKYNIYIFSITAGIFALSIIISRIFKLVKKHTTRDIVLNLILMAISVALAVGFFQKVDSDFISGVVLLECLFISICVFVEAVITSFSQLKLTTFVNVIMRTFALEILLGLVALIVGASLILMHIEPAMPRFGDAIWYCFAVVTTIGFGDIVAATPIGRVVSVILGIYGIVVVAVITSIIVNFYNETYGKRDAKEVKQLHEQNKHK